MEYALYSYLAHVITFWTAGGLFFLLDLKTEDSKKYKKFKIRKKKIDWNFYEKTAIDVLYTHLFVALPFNILISPLWEYFGCTWESIHYTLFDLIIILLIEEIIFFYLHYLFHKNKKLYKHVHLKHHEWIDPVAISALYAHPIEVIFCNYMPVLIGIFLTKFNFYGVLLVISIGTINALYVHSGYTFILDKKMGHYQHHLIYNKQYGVLGILDRIHKTN
jgi:fatty acid hydroxylase domain-containing protein 2